MDYTVLVLSISGFILLYFLYEIEWKRYRLDKLRDNLFIIRDSLFQAAARGELPLESQAYKIMRTNLNGMIRFSHDLSFFRLMLAHGEVNAGQGRKLAENYRSRFEAALKELTPEQRQLIISAQKQAHERVLLYVGFNSLLGTAIFGLVMVYAFVQVVVRRGIKAFSGAPKENFITNLGQLSRMRRSIEALDAEANHVGCLA